MPMIHPLRMRLPLLALAVLALLAALWAGLLRIGWAVPSFAPGLALAYGPLIVAGFLSTLISLERAVALERRWVYLAPLGGLGIARSAMPVTSTVRVGVHSCTCSATA